MDYIRTLSREFDVGDALDLTVENRAGLIAVRGSDEPGVRVGVIAHLWAESDAEADEQRELIDRAIQCDGHKLTVRAPTLLQSKPLFFFGRSPRIDYEVFVPTRCRADLRSRSGRVEVDGIDGPLEIGVRSGRTSVRDIADNVTVSSSSGSVQLERIAGDVNVSARSGGVRVDGCRGACKITSRSGAVQAEDIAGDLEIETRSGSTSVSNAGRSVAVSGVSGSMRYEGPICGHFGVDIVSGSIRLAVDPASAFMLDAESSHGSVRSDLGVRSDSPVARGDAPRVRLRTRSGAISIRYR